MRTIHLMNEASRDASIAIETVRELPTATMGLPGKKLSFRRYLAATEAGLHPALAERHGDTYAEALIDGDPEVDIEHVGRTIADTQPVYLSASGEVLYVSPRLVDVIFGPDGAERERRDVGDPVLANVNDEAPVRWTGRRLTKSQAVTRFAFRRTLAVKHVDGLTYDFLHAMAKQLADEGSMVMLGAGPKGRDPLIFQENGTPYRGFLEGRVDGARYQLLLHLSNLELRNPNPTETES
jgi:hypothetical protein